jgi:hypothetical protein
VLAGITLAAVGIPVALGYAKIAGMPVVTGLDTLLFPDGRHRNPRPHRPPQAGTRGPAQRQAPATPSGAGETSYACSAIKLLSYQGHRDAISVLTG